MTLEFHWLAERPYDCERTNSMYVHASSKQENAVQSYAVQYVLRMDGSNATELGTYVYRLENSSELGEI